ncbi:MAG: PspC domain-containing protein [Candidatus Brocadiia bacterium]|nr:PspC domain-containing protein [Candidatus Brocadiia bacterium]
MILGVCRGITEYADVSVFWVRLGAVALLVMSGVWPMVVVYVLAALLMKKEPVVTFSSDFDREFYESYASNRTLALRRLNRIYQRLDRRIQRIESTVTARGFDWDQRLHGS